MLSLLKLILRGYVALTGTISAYTFGLIQGISSEHRRFLSSGFTCQSCKAFLIRKNLTADVIICDEEGREVPMLQAAAKGKRMACPKCKHEWPLRSSR